MGILRGYNYTVESIPGEIAENLCRKITGDLPEYFGLPEANERYAQGIRTRTNLAIKLDDNPVGLISLEFLYPKSTTLYWMGILKEHHRHGLGTLLIKRHWHLQRIKGLKQ